MELWIGDEASPRAASGQVDDQLVEAGAPLRLRLVLAADEELAEAELILLGRSGPGAAASFSAPTLASDAASEGSFTGVSWVSADWGSGRSLAELALKVGGGAPFPEVQIKIARGGSGWYSPPGPHSFALDGGGAVEVSFPDTVADRLMLELLEDGAPVDRDLQTPAGASAVLPIRFGDTARDPSLRLADGRSLFEHSGAIATAGEVEVRELLASLRERVDGALRDREIGLELSAKAAGLVGLRWSFTVDRLLERFDDAGEQAEAELELGWSAPAEHPLAIADAVVRALSLRATWAPTSERVALAPDPDPAVSGAAVAGPDSTARGLAGLLRPRYQQAQSFHFTPTRPLLGVDLWVRSTRASVPLELSLDIVADAGGIPGSAPLATATLSLPAEQGRVGPRPSWLRVDLPEPLIVEAPRWWLVARVDEGELLWLLGGAEGEARRAELGELRHRRDEGPWLARELRDPQTWALTRLRVHEPTPAPMPALELVVDGEASALIAAEDEADRFELPPASAPAGATLSLRASSSVAGHLTLSQLSLRWRDEAPDPATGGVEVDDADDVVTPGP